MSAPSFFRLGFGAPIPPQYPESYLAGLRRQRELVTALCTALHEFLCYPMDTALEQAANVKPYKRPRPTIEDLNKAQDDLDLTHSQLDAIDRMCETLPEEVGNMLQLTQRPSIQRMLAQMEETVSWIQKELEQPEPEPGSPWDGSHNIGTLCAMCAKASEQIEHSIPALVKALKSDGWGRNPDGDHICPECLAKQESAALADTSTESATSPNKKESL